MFSFPFSHKSYYIRKEIDIIITEKKKFYKKDY